MKSKRGCFSFLCVPTNMKLENLRKMEVCSELMLPYILTGIICLLVGILLIGIPVGIQVRKQTAEK